MMKFSSDLFFLKNRDFYFLTAQRKPVIPFEFFGVYVEIK